MNYLKLEKIIGIITKIKKIHFKILNLLYVFVFLKINNKKNFLEKVFLITIFYLQRKLASHSPKYIFPPKKILS